MPLQIESYRRPTSAESSPTCPPERLPPRGFCRCRSRLTALWRRCACACECANRRPEQLFRLSSLPACRRCPAASPCTKTPSRTTPWPPPPRPSTSALPSWVGVDAGVGGWAGGGGGVRWCVCASGGVLSCLRVTEASPACPPSRPAPPFPPCRRGAERGRQGAGALHERRVALAHRRDLLPHAAQHLAPEVWEWPLLPLLPACVPACFLLPWQALRAPPLSLHQPLLLGSRKPSLPSRFPASCLQRGLSLGEGPPASDCHHR